MRSVTQIGLERFATILNYDESTGNVTVGLQDSNFTGTSRPIKIPFPASWSGPKGEFMGGYPTKGSTVVVAQGQAGQWYITNYSLSNTALQKGLLTSLRSGRALMQSANGYRIFVDPDVGIVAGDELNYIQIDPKLDIFSNNFNNRMYFAESGRNVTGIIRRDISEAARRSIGESTLTSHSYDRLLYSVPMDPSSAPAIVGSGMTVRNPPFVENRELVYEFAASYNVLDDSSELARYIDPSAPIKAPKIDRTRNRTDSLSLSQHYPNHLIEIIKGTAVDGFGNILDINKHILQVGKTDALSLRKNSNVEDAYNRIKAQLRKSVAYSFELNSKKGTNDSESAIVPDVTVQKNYGRDRSRFSFLIDKEGQFKLNVSSSSECGNVPLLTRAENFSTIMARQDPSVNALDFVKESTGQEIFLDTFTDKGKISLVADSVPVDRFTGEKIKLGTAYHDITMCLNQFQTSAGYIEKGVNLVRFDPTNVLNTTLVPYPHIVSSEIILSGPDANGGGRSGTINMDGSLVVNLGANTIDRQSLWMDCAGGIVTCVGRDKQNISVAATLDGDFLMQVGGPGIGNTYDERFEDQNDASRDGVVEIRVIMGGQHAILRIGKRPDGSGGIDIASPGTITISCEKDMILKTKASMKFEAENIVMYGETTKRIVRRHPSNTTI